MQFLVICGCPNLDSLCQSIMSEIVKGAADGGADVETLTLETIAQCKACNEGWGSCKTNHTCAFGKDGYDQAQAAVQKADALCLISPLSSGEMPELLKNFLERLRRCEFGPLGALTGKPILIVAAAGGFGSSLLSCLEHIDRFCRQTGAVIFDFFGVCRWNSDYTRVSAFSAAKAIAYGRKAGESF